MVAFLKPLACGMFRTEVSPLQRTAEGRGGIPAEETGEDVDGKDSGRVEAGGL